jgi:hypothetical protein
VGGATDLLVLMSQQLSRQKWESHTSFYHEHLSRNLATIHQLTQAEKLSVIPFSWSFSSLTTASTYIRFSDISHVRQKTFRFNTLACLLLFSVPL